MPDLSVSTLQINVRARGVESSDKEPSTRASRFSGAHFLYRNIVFILLPALACLLFASPLLVPGLVLILSVFFLRWFALASPFPETRVNWLVLIFLLAVLWSMLRAADLNGTILTIARILGGVALLYVIVDYADHPGRLWNVAAGLVGAGGVIAFLAPFITEPSPDKLVDVTFLFRAGLRGFEQSNPNMIAGVLASLLPLAIALVIGSQEGEGASRDDWSPLGAQPAQNGGAGGLAEQQGTVQVRRLVGAISMAPMLAMLLLLQARGAWVAAFAGVILYLSLFRRWLIALVPLTILLLLLLNSNSEVIISALPFQMNSFQFTLGLQGRQVVWDYAAREIVREPLGHGINTFRLYAANAASDLLATPQRQHAHNLFLQVGFETGLVGLAAFAALFGYALYASGHAVVRRVKHDLASAVFAALCAALLSTLLEANMWGNISALVLWALFGMAVVLGRYGARRRRRQRGKSLQESVSKP